MVRSYDESAMGCGTIALGYVLGSYFVACVAVLAGIWHSSLLIAPITLPLFLAMGAALVGNSEMPVDLTSLLIAIAIWVFSAAGFAGMLRSWHTQHRRRWPVFALFAAAALAIGFLVAIHRG